jgi:hypothetical protein
MSIPTEDEIKAEALRLRIDKRMSYREIAHELGLSLGKVSEYLKGVPLPILKQKDTAPDQPVTKDAPGVSVHHLITEEKMSKLFALALDEGFPDPNLWIDRMLIPWYEIKRRFEWMMRMKLDPLEFGSYIEACMLDSIELRDIKDRLNKMTGSPAPPALTTPQTPVGANNPGGKAS